jgi:hypothetical protein
MQVYGRGESLQLCNIDQTRSEAFFYYCGRGNLAAAYKNLNQSCTTRGAQLAEST